MSTPEPTIDPEHAPAVERPPARESVDPPVRQFGAASDADGEPRPVFDPDEQLEPLPPATRIAMWIVGTIFLLIGLVGLALPVVPQAVPLALGVAFLSLASERFYSLIARNVERWPKMARRLARLRATLHRWFS